jgi:hypothetical protein
MWREVEGYCGARKELDGRLDGALRTPLASNAAKVVGFRGPEKMLFHSLEER